MLVTNKSWSSAADSNPSSIINRKLPLFYHDYYILLLYTCTQSQFVALTRENFYLEVWSIVQKGRSETFTRLGCKWSSTVLSWVQALILVAMQPARLAFLSLHTVPPSFASISYHPNLKVHYSTDLSPFGPFCRHTVTCLEICVILLPHISAGHNTFFCAMQSKSFG